MESGNVTRTGKVDIKSKITEIVNSIKCQLSCENYVRKNIRCSLSKFTTIALAYICSRYMAVPSTSFQPKHLLLSLFKFVSDFLFYERKVHTSVSSFCNHISTTNYRLLLTAAITNSLIKQIFFPHQPSRL